MAGPPPPDVAKTIAFIFVPGDENKLKPNGTAFFVLIANDKGPGAYGYIVTAMHVLKDSDGDFFKRIFLRINDKNSGSQLLSLDLVPSGDKQNFFVHHDPTVDIAVIPGWIDESKFDVLGISEQFIKTREEIRKSTLRPGSDVFFAGLFAPHLGEKANTPIFRFGRVAMFPEERIRWQEAGKQAESVELYLLETMSFGGNSGSPVFFSQGMDRIPGQIVLGADEITLAGVMRGNFNEPRPGVSCKRPILFCQSSHKT